MINAEPIDFAGSAAIELGSMSGNSNKANTNLGQLKATNLNLARQYNALCKELAPPGANTDKQLRHELAKFGQDIMNCKADLSVISAEAIDLAGSAVHAVNELGWEIKSGNDKQGLQELQMQVNNLLYENKILKDEQSVAKERINRLQQHFELCRDEKLEIEAQLAKVSQEFNEMRKHNTNHAANIAPH